MDFSKKVILLTGASRGIGLAIAKKFNQLGADLHLVSRNFSDDYQEHFDKSQGQTLTTYNVDLSQAKQVSAFIDKFRKQGAPDILVNNAGLLTGGKLQDIDPGDIEKTIAVNLTATIQLTRGFIDLMTERGSGLVINNASVSGEFYFPGAQVYAASKGGVVLFTKSLRMELQDTGVDTLLLMTPAVETSMFDDLREKYKSMVDVSIFKAMTADEWAGEVIKAVQAKKDICYPKGSTRVGLFLNRHFSPIYEMAMNRYFNAE